MLFRVDTILDSVGQKVSFGTNGYPINGLWCIQYELSSSMNARAHYALIAFEKVWSMPLLLGNWRFAEWIYRMSVAFYHFHFLFAVTFDVRHVQIGYKWSAFWQDH